MHGRHQGINATFRKCKSNHYYFDPREEHPSCVERCKAVATCGEVQIPDKHLFVSTRDGSGEGVLALTSDILRLSAMPILRAAESAYMHCIGSTRRRGRDRRRFPPLCVRRQLHTLRE